MRILLVSWYFPPVNTIGAVRVGKFARFLQEAGHEIGVVAGKNWGHPETLPLEARIERIAYAAGFDVNAVPASVVKALTRRIAREPDGPATTPSPDAKSTIPEQPGGATPTRRLSRLYADVTNIPDNRIGWLSSACREGLVLCRDWRPDVIFASGPPFTALLAARRISRRLGVPWVAELRDRWADDPYDTSPRWRRAINERLERHVLATAQALVTVTEPWAEFYRAKYAKPVATIYNGYDPADFVGEPEDTACRSDSHLVIGYAGSIYPGRRDPTPLFEALRLLGKTGDRFRVVFCGTNLRMSCPWLRARASRILSRSDPVSPIRTPSRFNGNQMSCC